MNSEQESSHASEMRAHVRDSFENSAARRLVIVADNGSTPLQRRLRLGCGRGQRSEQN